MAHHARNDHAEMISKDPAATQKFMEKAFGLKFNEMGAEMGNYRMHGKTEGAEGGSIGLRGLMGPETTGTVVYLTVPNIDDGLKAATGAGAKVVMGKTEIPGMGWSAVYITGEVLQGLFQAKK